MPTKTVVGHFSKSEFFSVLPPGFYIFMVIYSCYIVKCNVHSSHQSLFNIIISLAQKINSNFTLLLFILFASYLLGSISRALPVRWAEHSFPRFHCKFPYPDRLNEVLNTLQVYGFSTKLNLKKIIDLSQGVPMHLFNYWKDFICIVTPEGFEFYQTFETRSRFFAGIIWAALFGIIGGLYIIIITWNNRHGVGLPLLILSFILYITFGANFRRVRAQEAQALLMIYLAYFHKELSTTKQ
jgi:hypothetical protein